MLTSLGGLTADDATWTCLQEALGGNAKTSLVIAVANAKEHVDESLQSLQFGSRAMHVSTAAVVNEHADLKLVNAELASAMEQHIDTGGVMSASLLAKQEELESANARLRVGLPHAPPPPPPLSPWALVSHRYLPVHQCPTCQQTRYDHHHIYIRGMMYALMLAKQEGLQSANARV